MDMDRVFGHIRSRIDSDCLVTNARDQIRDGCKMSMQGIAEKKCILVDVDVAFRNRPSEKRCDFILFVESLGGHLMVVPIELKNTRVEPSSLCAQLQAGASYAAGIIPQGIQCICVPVVIHGKKIPTRQRDSLGKEKVSFRKTRSSIKTVRCDISRNLFNAISASR